MAGVVRDIDCRSAFRAADEDQRVSRAGSRVQRWWRYSLPPPMGRRSHFSYPKEGNRMKSNRPISYLATAAISAMTSTAGAQVPALGDPEPEQRAEATPPAGPATEPPAPM